MPYCDSNGTKLYYEVLGEGDPVLFANGVFMNTTGWVLQKPVFTANYKTIFYDMRGQGQSDKPDQEYTFEMHAADQKALLDHLGISKIHHVGISYGAELGMFYALKYPETLKSLVISNAVSYLGPLLQHIGSLWKHICKLADPNLFYYATVPFNFSESFMNKNPDFFKEAIERYKQFDFKSALKLIDSFLQLNIQNEDLGKISIPTCIIASENDILKPPNPYSNHLHNHIPNSELFIIPDSGHAVILENPTEFNSIVENFINNFS